MKKKENKENKSSQKDNTYLTNSSVLDIARNRFKSFLPLQADGYSCSTEQLLDVLLSVCVNRDTIESVCSELQLKVGAETIRGYFKEQLKSENLAHLQEVVNQTLQANLSKSLLTQELEVAVDFHDQPYYGKTEQTDGLWVQGKAEKGTTRFYRVATLYVIKNGHRKSLAVFYVTPNKTTKEVLEYLLKQLQTIGIGTRCLYLDRGFASIEIIRYLKSIRQKTILACPIRGKTGGVKALCVGGKSYRTKHTFKSHKLGQEETQIVIYRGFTTSKRKGNKKKRKLKWLAYILIGIDKNISAKKVKENYKKRFGIETSYRCSNKVRGWTTSANVAYRFLLIGMSFVMTNIWQELQEKWTRKKQVGPRVWKKKNFRLKRFANFVRKAIENIYGIVERIEKLAKINQKI